MEKSSYRRSLCRNRPSFERTLVENIAQWLEHRGLEEVERF
ncbi:MAG: hypothetical protein ACLFV5_04120 [Anaerolineales bacterium]